MTKYRLRFYAFLLSIGLSSLLFFGYAQACSISPPYIYVRCGDDEASGRMLIAHQAINKMESDQDFENAYAKLQANNSKCTQYIASLRTIFKQNYENWLAGVYSSYLTFEPYSAARELQLKAKRNELTSCRYEEFRRDGDWLITYYAARKYCLPGYCWNYSLSPGHFFSFLLENLNGQIAPYLLGYFLFTVILAGLFLVFLLSPLRRQHKVEIGVIFALISGLIWFGDHFQLNPLLYSEMVVWGWGCFIGAMILSVIWRIYKRASYAVPS
jgi:hypothetical protein